ncbi:MAG: Mth938-like domain-containing protein [Methanothermobacter tenebrarum]|uniref:Uncharacterized protein n=2 Tax=Methanothermobacter tenebrarum TaxID=680118 RepID=A0A328PC75_9EURY|nr:hypothetical protein [Methanobacteriaceae archaeon]RAO79350.1 hypothetical protein DPC56_03305 [Methanothermobacter tenebrarum]
MKFQDCKFGSVKYNGKEYKHDIIVHVDGTITPRRKEISRKKYGTSHTLAQEEIQQLLDENPDIIIVGSGVHGVLKLGEISIKTKIIKLPTCKAIKEYNSLIETGKKVAAIIHVTC